MRRFRIALAILLFVTLMPLSWLRMAEPPREIGRGVSIAELQVGAARAGPFTLAGAWQLTGDPVRFGGFSSLVVRDNSHFLSGSDGGRRLDFDRPDRPALAPGRLGSFFGAEESAKKGRDLESLAFDPATGTLWGGLEFRQSIVRFDARYRPEAEVRPQAMRKWEPNGGPETLVRLADGRFLAVEERPRRWRGHHHAALLFAGDPVDDPQPRRLTLEFPHGYSPVDATPVDGARALVLLRRVDWGLPPGFDSALALVDVDRRDAKGMVRARLLAELETGFPHDNYEGVAMTQDADGRHVWLISDDNFMSFQRTLLLKLAWRPREKARE